MTTEYAITYYGEDWDAEDFDGYASNADGTGFLDAVAIVKRTYP